MLLNNGMNAAGAYYTAKGASGDFKSFLHFLIENIFIMFITFILGAIVGCFIYRRITNNEKSNKLLTKMKHTAFG